MSFGHKEIEQWLKESDEKKLQQLRRLADNMRRKHVGDEVHLRGLLEISNHCKSLCAYCGINRRNVSLKRYRMNEEEILKGATVAHSLGYGTVVLQSGLDRDITKDSMARTIKLIKERTSMAVTLSLGERSPDELALWRKNGADRYLLRFETSNPQLYRKIHPPVEEMSANRLQLLKELKSLGYEVGSGVMVGIPGQSYDSLARDISLFRELDLDMIGVGPYIPHPLTSLGKHYNHINKVQKNIQLKPSSLMNCNRKGFNNAQDQVPNTTEMTLKVLGLTRITCPDANLPTTTALNVIDPESGRSNGLLWGGNVIMPNVTPHKYRVLYDIYPFKSSSTATETATETDTETDTETETIEETHAAVVNCIRSLGRRVGGGRGDSVNWKKRTAEGQVKKVVP